MADMDAIIVNHLLYKANACEQQRHCCYSIRLCVHMIRTFDLEVLERSCILQHPSPKGHADATITLGLEIGILEHTKVIAAHQGRCNVL